MMQKGFGQKNCLLILSFLEDVNHLNISLISLAIIANEILNRISRSTLNNLTGPRKFDLVKWIYIHKLWVQSIPIVMLTLLKAVYSLN